MLKQIDGLQNFFEIKDYSNYAVSREGVVVNRKTGYQLTGSKNPAGYHNFRLTDNNGKTKTWGRHRLLMYVFDSSQQNIDDLYVNHKNGVKGSDNLENLEWATPKQNVEHAGINGLTSKCIPISVRDWDTKKVSKYASVKECSRQTGLTKDAILHRLKIGEERIFPERKQYRISHDDKPWCDPQNPEQNISLNGRCEKLLVRDVITNTEMCFESISAFSEKYKIPLPTVSLWLSKKDQPVVPGYFQLKRFSDTSPWRTVNDPYLELANYTKQVPVKMMNIRTGEEYVFSSAKECAEFAGLGTTTLNYRLSLGGKKVFSDGCCYSYYGK